MPFWFRHFCRWLEFCGAHNEARSWLRCLCQSTRQRRLDSALLHASRSVVQCQSQCCKVKFTLNQFTHSACALVFWRQTHVCLFVDVTRMCACLLTSNAYALVCWRHPHVCLSVDVKRICACLLASNARVLVCWHQMYILVCFALSHKHNYVPICWRHTHVCLYVEFKHM